MIHDLRDLPELEGVTVTITETFPDGLVRTQVFTFESGIPETLPPTHPALLDSAG
jgi:hypothetical protein